MWSPPDVLSLVRRRLQLPGSFGGRTRQDMPRLVRYVAVNKIDIATIITNRYPFNDVSQAISDLDGGKLTGRAVIAL